MIAIRNGGMAARVPTAIAIGASIAAVATLPGPSDAIRPASAKNMIGTRPVLPRADAQCRATRSSVELRLREQQRTPASVRNNCTGKPPSTSVEAHAAEIHADDPRQREARALTLSSLKQLTIIASTSAASESQGEGHRASVETASGASQQVAQQCRRMDGLFAREIGDLVAARGAGGDDDGAGGLLRIAGKSLRSPIARATS